jgi:transposase, IS30 family
MYYHLTQNQRIELSLLLRLGHSKRASARVLGVSPSTISRETIRNTAPTRRYHATYARMRTVQRRVEANQHLRKLAHHPALCALIAAKLTHEQWSPEQIAAWLCQARHAVRVCTQTIYDWLYVTREDLLVHLRSQKQRYRRTRANTLRKQQRAALFAARRIDQRPVAVAGRHFYGHWEGDTMVSRQGKPGRIGTLVERKSGYLVAFLLPNGESRGFATAAANALMLGGIPLQYLKTMTLDNGSEMQSYEVLERLTPLHVFFAYPYHSWERGTNENTNGLLRQYFPKGSDLGLATQAQLDAAVTLLNTRPRKRLGYRTPAELFERRW